MNGTRTVENYIDGGWCTADDYFDAVDPATGEPLVRAPASTERDVDAAVHAARRAFRTWRFVNPAVRARYLHAIGDGVSSRQRELAEAVTAEMGKTISEATSEVTKLAAAFHFYAEEATRVYGDIVPNDSDGYSSQIYREPVGVVGAITPWNYPLELIGWKLCAAVAAGCAIVVKPSQFASLSPALLFDIIGSVGLPAGVANLVFGHGRAGSALVAHRGVDKVAFTGSTSTGAAIARSVPTAKPLTMELGGTCPMIVTDKADVAAAVTGAARRGFRNAGQICIAVNRIYAHDSVYDEFVDGLTAAVETLVTGNGMTEGVDVGAMATRAGLDVVVKHIDDARDKGGRVTVGGALLPDLGPGHFHQPTVVAECTDDMVLMQDETFGPVVGVMRYTDLDTAVEMANGTDSGLAAYVFTRDLEQTHELGRLLDFGNVAVNNVDAGIMNAPYGGRKGSGFGTEHGKEGLENYLQYKHLRIRYGS
ncbi:aldehyde dehydrogenase family protein [Rhodococcus sp. BP-349]|nr:aldehyde dehydrogenase family protein [Rhodococcus sp. BP-363]MBY6541619.1 aldehyde dehydrogenase family protein [Rhodococcus sp. BP-369]MBY6560849.1 aldehyde dehydrogenase family protein [Rhodococcus sp. BP-370]MBY6575141.1 aldehyde dehydrogenase family protein [Rhodococcus sp. BP-364]MBY6584442.1 aldehyde dehydrogenase family protein [Rhodococcus sp. BP-358]MBY6588779.1 aldehyde dehydrogenase family protein [Rhodococcus sp. BP-362]MBY6594688.1 aldehyde dehydrogenase family protein [Rhodo